MAGDQINNLHFWIFSPFNLISKSPCPHLLGESEKVSVSKTANEHFRNIFNKFINAFEDIIFGHC